MYRRSFQLSSLLAVLLVWLTGCGRDESTTTTPTSESPTAEPAVAQTIGRWYWAGKDQVSADTNSHDLMVIWNLPESIALQNQTLDKLATAPWRFLQQDQSTGQDETTESPSAELLRPILDDLLQQECYLEISQVADQFPDLALAIKVDEERAGIWATNLAEALHSLKGRQPEPSAAPKTGWSLSLPDSGKFIELGRSGDWTILGLTEGSNSLTADFASRISNDGLPFDRSFAADWVNADLNLRRIAAAYGFKAGLPKNIPSLALSVNGDGQYVRSRGELVFPHPLNIKLEPWNVPTNLITGELHSLVAARGIQAWLQNWETWSRFKLGSPPNQLFGWGYDGLPAQFYLAAPVNNASNRVESLTSQVLEKGREWNATNELGGFTQATAFHGLTWKGVPFLYPFVKSVTLDQGDFVVAGSVVVNESDPSPPAGLIGTIFDKTNSVYVEREFTGGQITQWLYIGQFARYVTHQAQLPAKSAGRLWLRALTPVVGSSGTDVTLNGPSQLNFARTSGSGFTAIELHLLADWLESPAFPFGLHTFEAEPDPTAALP